MFPSAIDVGLHLIAVILSYLFFGEFAAKAYIGFALLNLIILWALYGDYVECLKGVPIWGWNLGTNLVLLLVIMPALIEFARTRIDILCDRLNVAKDILLQPPNFAGKYRLDKVCDSGCAEQSFAEKIGGIEQSLKFYEAFLKSLWLDTLPFAWGFFLLSLGASVYIALNKKY
jgi:hypothetical protein